ncbi:hypothetical protein [Halobacillus naozhouensis]|uniref:YfzA-like protein n=1 Tax=Halobacillus naozhouensis TaxID=554880 RepID=A0ABY8J3A1_9BACI|nr:hypothetical protein [Halobacillus naozhouensis]WFT76062.1 hypothetical protein P9989_06780 [Halobacillus naozhouensis]
MKRILSFLLLLFILNYSFLFLQDNVQYFVQGDVQESITLESTFPSVDNTGNDLSISVIMLFTLAIILITNFLNRLVPFIRRLFFLNPVFYQSNFVIHLL